MALFAVKNLFFNAGDWGLHTCLVYFGCVCTGVCSPPWCGLFGSVWMQWSHLSAHQKQTKQGDVRMLSNKLWTSSFVAIMWSNLCQTALWSRLLSDYRSQLCCAILLICAILLLFATMATHHVQPWSHEEMWSLPEMLVWFQDTSGQWVMWMLSNDLCDLIFCLIHPLPINWFGPGKTALWKGAETVIKCKSKEKLGPSVQTKWITVHMWKHP